MNELNERSLRIISIMNDANMNATQFAEAIGIQRAAMSHIMGGRNNPSADVMDKIVKRFPSINAGWLLSGIGDMKITPDKQNIGYTADNRHDLFYQHDTAATDNTRSEGDIRTEIHFTDKKSEGEGVKELANISETTEKELIIYKERPVKTIDKLLIFYSDNTYEAFIPEKHNAE